LPKANLDRIELFVDKLHARLDCRLRQERYPAKARHGVISAGASTPDEPVKISRISSVPSLDRHPAWSPLARWVPNRVNRSWPQELAKHGSSSTTLHSLLFIINFDMADEIADNFDLFGIAIRNLYASEFIFDQYCQLETIEPVGAQILTEVRLIRDAADIDTEIVGNENTYSASINFLCCRRG
jgi:hypothetical protein